VEYLPFGEVWIEETDPATGYIPFRFTSKELDEETGLYYHGARYYEPTISRWMSADPAGFTLSSPMGSDGKPKASYSIIEAVNWYAYVSNNPVIYVDPTGNQQIPGEDRAFYKVSDEVVEGWISDWVSISNYIDKLENEIHDLRSELSFSSWQIKGQEIGETIRLLPFIIHGFSELKSTGSAQTLGEVLAEATNFYIEELDELYKRTRSIPYEIEIIESEIQVKEQMADNLLELIEGQAKLDLWLKE